MSFVVVIPARYQSTRLPGKPLADIHGKPMIQWVAERALQAGAERVIVATDDERVAAAVTLDGVEICMTSPSHQSGTERLAEVCERYAFDPDTILVNVQGDEPLIPPSIIRQVAENLAQAEAPMATLAVPMSDEEIFNPNAVKVVMDRQGYALYFSRAPSPGSGMALHRRRLSLATPMPAIWGSTPTVLVSSSAMSVGRRASWSRSRHSNSYGFSGTASVFMSLSPPRHHRLVSIPARIWPGCEPGWPPDVSLLSVRLDRAGPGNSVFSPSSLLVADC